MYYRCPIIVEKYVDDMVGLGDGSVEAEGGLQQQVGGMVGLEDGAQRQIEDGLHDDVEVVDGLVEEERATCRWGSS